MAKKFITISLKLHKYQWFIQRLSEKFLFFLLFIQSHKICKKIQAIHFRAQITKELPLQNDVYTITLSIHRSFQIDQNRRLVEADFCLYTDSSSLGLTRKGIWEQECLKTILFTYLAINLLIGQQLIQFQSLSNKILIFFIWEKVRRSFVQNLIRLAKSNNDFTSWDYKFIMSKLRIKAQDDPDQFQELLEEVQTMKPSEAETTTKSAFKSNPRAHYLLEKHKLGLLPPPPQPQPRQHIQNKREAQIETGKIIKVGSVIFRSNFQSGSLGDVELIGVNSFRLTLENETNSSRGNAWFDFIVQGLKGQANFTITGFKKKKSLYNEGMKLCYREGNEKIWKRGGTQISYSLDRSAKEEQIVYELKFLYFFKNIDFQSVQFAYCFPYGIARLQSLLNSIHSLVKIQTLASSFEGKDLSIVNIGNLTSKQIIVLSARVHPGQSVSSFIMEGFLRQITSNSDYARYLRDKFLFKIMPIINVDGVRHGNFRFSASGVDLNRRWKEPSQQHHPEIYYLKQMILKQSKQKRIRMFIDMHGHSRKKNVFFYGCCQEGQDISKNFEPKAFPYLMSRIYQAYNYDDCSFAIQQQKEGTARISLWNQLRINEIYTLQASFCGSQKGSNYLQNQYMKIGQKLCQGVALYFYQSTNNEFPLLSKALNFRQNTYNQLSSSIQLLKQGNQTNSGSDSEPQKGQKTSIHIRDKNNFQQNKSKKKKQRQQQIISKTKRLHNQESASHKHKSENEEKDHVELELLKLEELFPHTKINIVKTDFDEQISQRIINQNQQHDHSKNIRIHHLSKPDNSPQIAKLTQYKDIQNTQLAEDIHRKSVNRIVSALENTQYRRVRNMMQQKISTKVIQERRPSDTKQIYHSLKKRIPTPDNTHKGVIPRFYANTPVKRRQNSVDIFYKKPNKNMIVGNKIPKDSQNVFCLGKQIIF